jgi:hypothetical protein
VCVVVVGWDIGDERSLARLRKREKTQTKSEPRKKTLQPTPQKHKGSLQWL